MTYDPYKIIPAILVAAYKDDEVLLTRRKNTSYMDGWYSLPGGHLEEHETLQEGAAREMEEETGIKINPENLELFRIYQNKNTPDRQYIGFIFRINKWSGDAGVVEEKSDDVKFFSLGKLPEKIIPYHREAINYLKSSPKIDITFTPLGSFDPSGR